MKLRARVLMKIDNRLTGAEIAAIDADRFGQRAHLQRHAGFLSGDKAAALAAGDHAEAVRVVGHQPGVMRLGQFGQLDDRREIPVPC